jgi:hypothetical protein
VHITTRESIPPQAPGVYVFECYFQDELDLAENRIVVAVLGQSEPKYGCAPPLPAVGAAVVADDPGTHTRVASADLNIAENTLTIGATASSPLVPTQLVQVRVRYYYPIGDAYGEPVDTVVMRAEPGSSYALRHGAPFVGTAPGIETYRGDPQPPRPPQTDPWFKREFWSPPVKDNQLPWMGVPPNSDYDIDNDGHPDYYFESSIRGGGSELRAIDRPPYQPERGGPDMFVGVIPIPGTDRYKIVGACPWPQGGNDWWIDENGLAHWLSIDISSGVLNGANMYHWVYNPYTGKLRLWCGHYTRADGWLGHDWADPPEDFSTFLREWRCIFSER